MNLQTLRDDGYTMTLDDGDGGYFVRIVPTPPEPLLSKIKERKEEIVEELKEEVLEAARQVMSSPNFFDWYRSRPDDYWGYKVWNELGWRASTDVTNEALRLAYAEEQDYRDDRATATAIRINRLMQEEGRRKREAQEALVRIADALEHVATTESLGDLKDLANNLLEDDADSLLEDDTEVCDCCGEPLDAGEYCTCPEAIERLQEEEDRHW